MLQTSPITLYFLGHALYYMGQLESGFDTFGLSFLYLGLTVLNEVITDQYRDHGCLVKWDDPIRLRKDKELIPSDKKNLS